MKRYNEFVVKVEENMNLEVSEDWDGKIIIRVSNTDNYNGSLNKLGQKIILKKNINIYSKNYINPPVPSGYKHICGEWNNGYVIKRELDGSCFVWIPVGSLCANGTLDGVNFNEMFGRRNYRNDEFSKNGFFEILNNNLILMLESVKKYGGFYISCYLISMNKKTGNPQSVKNEIPWTGIKFDNVVKIAARFENRDTITSHLTFGAEYDSVLEWLIETDAKRYSEIVKNSTSWGNYCNASKSLERLEKTGSEEEWRCNNIYDLAGNIDEWTQEQKGISNRVVRGGNFWTYGNKFPVSYRNSGEINEIYKDTGFRITLCIK